MGNAFGLDPLLRGHLRYHASINIISLLKLDIVPDRFVLLLGIFIIQGVLVISHAQLLKPVGAAVFVEISDDDLDRVFKARDLLRLRHHLFLSAVCRQVVFLEELIDGIHGYINLCINGR